MRKNDILCLEGTCRVSTMIIDWKEEETFSKRSELTIMNSSKNDIRSQIYHNIAKKRGLKTNTHFFVDEVYKRIVCATLDKPTTDTMTTLIKEEPLD
jgi:hypothetical protein